MKAKIGHTDRVGVRIAQRNTKLRLALHDIPVLGREFLLIAFYDAFTHQIPSNQNTKYPAILTPKTGERSGSNFPQAPLLYRPGSGKSVGCPNCVMNPLFTGHVTYQVVSRGRKTPISALPSPL